MQAIQIKNPSGGSAGLDLIELPIPKLSNPHDILVKVHAVALNPADPKLRSTRSPSSVPGFDGAGIVIEAGTNAQFAKDDEVMWSYAGDLSRNGSHAQYQVVDSRLAGRKPKNLAWDEAAALPVAGLTAWEVFELKFRLKPDSNNPKEILLVLGGAGGVGAVAIQLAKKVFGIDRVIATASRPETIDFVKRMGATDVISHREDLGPQLQALGLQPSLVFLSAEVPRYLKELTAHLAPFAQIGCVVDSQGEIVPIHEPSLFFKSISFHWEMMPNKAIFQIGMEEQGTTTTRLGQLAADGTILSMVTKRGPLTVASIRDAHDLLESGTAIGKHVFTVGDSLA